MDGIIGEIRAFAFGYYPQGWLPCDGSTVPVQPYTPLYSIIGNRFGGTPNSTFTLPDLRALAVVNPGQRPGQSNYTWGSNYGTAGVALYNNQMPSHDHDFNGRTGSPASTTTPGNNNSYLSNFTFQKTATTRGSLLGYVDPELNPVTINPNSVTPFGSPSNAAHENRSPFATALYCICWDGTYPERP